MINLYIGLINKVSRTSTSKRITFNRCFVGFPSDSLCAGMEVDVPVYTETIVIATNINLSKIFVVTTLTRQADYH